MQNGTIIMIIPGLAKVNGCWVRSGQSTTSTVISAKLDFKAFSRTEIMDTK